MSTKRAPWASNTQAPQPDGKLRRSQLITAYGPGAMVDLVADAVVIGGLDFWQGDGMEVLHEPRLCASLNARRRRQGLRELHTHAPFRAAPMGDDQQPRRSAGIRPVTASRPGRPTTSPQKRMRTPPRSVRRGWARSDGSRPR